MWSNKNNNTMPTRDAANSVFRKWSYVGGSSVP